jgi:Flp pilus assembly protein TadD
MRTLRILIIAACLLGSCLHAEEPVPHVSPEAMPRAKEAKKRFEAGDFVGAEDIYNELLKSDPRNVYLLSNLGVALFRENKYKLAEEAFLKAVAVAPGDGFSHCTLGIVYYSTGKYAEAIKELETALTINPKDATAHNYLGITWSQKGSSEKAQMELGIAVKLDPNYADAAFNLAVVLATGKPAKKAEARKYYHRALSLGSEPDPALEQLIKDGPDPADAKPPLHGMAPPEWMRKYSLTP